MTEQRITDSSGGARLARAFQGTDSGSGTVCLHSTIIEHRLPSPAGNAALRNDIIGGVFSATY